MKACVRSDKEIVRLLLEHEHINVNQQEIFYGNTALMMASERGHIECVKLGLEHKSIDVNKKIERVQRNSNRRSFSPKKFSFLVVNEPN